MSEEPKNQIRQLSRIQRRVIGVLMEKAFTTPDQYPLTLKATMTACNQKSNRSPLTQYSESDVQDALDEMREDLLVAEVFTDGGRAPRYRHYMRHKFDFSEAQFAIIAELLLRGRQQPGELRTRAGRMVKIESQQQLRDELISLKEKGFIQSTGPLERRGVEVDHTFYQPKENRQLEDSDPQPASATASSETSSTHVPESANTQTAPPGNAGWEQIIAGIQSTIRDQAETITKLESALDGLDERLQRLERDLGV